MDIRIWCFAMITWSIAACSTSAVSATESEGRPPNIILMMADDFGYECVTSNGGQSYQTPTLDRLAKAGIRFQHCYAQPLCTPSRVKLMTGMSNIRNYVRFGQLHRSQTTFAHLLKAAGYRTCVVGKWQLGQQKDSPTHFGFEQSCLWQHTRIGPSRYPNPGLEINGETVEYRDGEYGPDLVSDFACEFMKQHRDEPFLIYYPMILTHCPFEPTPESKDWDSASPGSPTYKGDAKYFGDMVRHLDRTVEKLVQQVEELGLRENTILLFTGDNGTDRPVVSRWNNRDVAGGKKRTTDAGTRVPFIAYGPGTIPSGQVTDELISFSDFLPTLCELAGAEIPSELTIDGISFAPQLKGSQVKRRSWIYCWFSRSGKPGTEQIFARDRVYKLYSDGRCYHVAEDMDEKTPLKKEDVPAEVYRELLAAIEQFKSQRRSALPQGTAPKR